MDIDQSPPDHHPNEKAQSSRDNSLDSPLQEIKRHLPAFLALAVLVVVGLSIYADLPDLITAMTRFSWALLPVVVALTAANYLLRFLKWQYYLRIIGVQGLGWVDSLLIFFSGLAMVVTPGRVGEWLKSYLLQQARGVPVTRSAPIIVAERLTDGLAMVFLATGGLLVHGNGLELLLLVLILMVSIVALVQSRSATARVLGWANHVPFLSKRIGKIHKSFDSAQQLLDWKPLILAVGIGLVSWGAKCGAFYFILVALGVDPSIGLLVQSAFILSAATLLGGLSMLPGGLVVAEGSLTGMLMVFGITNDSAIAAAGTLLIRFASLWTGVVAGIVALSFVGKRVSQLSEATQREEAVVEGARVR
jgi:glycosyltransferase 2 family protein